LIAKTHSLGNKNAQPAYADRAFFNSSWRFLMDMEVTERDPASINFVMSACNIKTIKGGIAVMCSKGQG
jgi:hypothetical protein